MPMREMAKLCLLVFLFFGESICIAHTAAFGDDNGINKLLLEKIQTLEKRMDIDMKILKSELRREIRGASRRGTDISQTKVPFEMKTLQTSMYQLVAGLDSLKSEMLNEQCTRCGDMAENFSSLNENISRLSGTVEEIQHQLSVIGSSLGHVTKTGDDVPEVVDTSLVTTPAPATQGYLDHANQIPHFLRGTRVATVKSPYVNEASGICASRIHKNVLYTHNDSGDTQRIFALDASTGVVLAVIHISGAMSQDWEDIACGPCAGGSGHCIYIADTGGNAGGLSNTIYRIKEPDTIREQTVAIDSALMFSWDQDNCETLMVDPRGQVYVISKVKGGKGKFVRLPSTAWGRPNRTHVTDGVYLTIWTVNENPTGGDISPDGREMLVKNYRSVFYWYVPDGNYYSAIVKTPTTLPYTREPQGESIGWDSQGHGYYTLSEGLNSTLFYYQRVGYPIPGSI